MTLQTRSLRTLGPDMGRGYVEFSAATPTFRDLTPFRGWRHSGRDLAAGEGAIVRGGDFFNFPSVAGVFAIDATSAPSDSSDEIGFRCAR